MNTSMNLRTLKNKELHERLKYFLDQENKLNQEILIHLIEVDRRKLFLQMAFPSLFEYLTIGIGFSAASAQRRIDAARLMRQIPELGGQIQSGSISLVQIGKIQAASRLLRKRGTVVSIADKKDILNEIQNKTVKETELIIAKKFDLPIATYERSVVQKDESIRMEMTFSKEEMEKIETAKALLSHSLSDGSVKGLILYLSDKVIKQKSITRVVKTQMPKVKVDIQANTLGVEIDQKYQGAKDKNESFNRINVKNGTKTGNVSINENSKQENVTSEALNSVGVASLTKAQSAGTKKFIFRRDLGCQYQDLVTGKKCKSRYFLEVDHIRPKWAGGTDDIANLRALCSAHNKFRYQVGR